MVDLEGNGVVSEADSARSCFNLCESLFLPLFSPVFSSSHPVNEINTNSYLVFKEGIFLAFILQSVAIMKIFADLWLTDIFNK